MTVYLVAFFGGVIGTILAIAFGYVGFSEFSGNWDMALQFLWAWPWISFPVLMTVSSMGWPFVIRTLSPNPTLETEWREISAYTIVTTLIGVAMAYPGREALGFGAGGSLVAVIICCVVVQFLVAFIMHEVVKTLNEGKTLAVTQKSLRKSYDDRDVFSVHTDDLVRKRLAVRADLGDVELEDVDCSWDSWRSIDVGSDVWVGAGSNLVTKHSLLIRGSLEVRGGSLKVAHVLMLRKGGYTIGGGIEARAIISLGGISVDGDLTVEGSIICEGNVSCSGILLAGGIIEAYCIETPDPEQVRRDNFLGKATRVERSQ